MLVAQSCVTVCDPMDYSPPGSSAKGFSRQAYWSGLPFPSPGDLLRSLALWEDSLLSETPEKPLGWEWLLKQRPGDLVKAGAESLVGEIRHKQRATGRALMSWHMSDDQVN